MFNNVIQYFYLSASQKYAKIKYVKTHHLAFSAIILKCVIKLMNIDNFCKSC